MNRNARRVSAVEIPSSSPPRRRRPSTTDAGPSGFRKRRRLTNQTVSSSGSQAENEHENEAVESIDLTDVDGNSAIAKVLAKQREDAIASQHLNDGGGVRSKLAAYKCPICMDSPVDATTTVCAKNSERITPGKHREVHAQSVANLWPEPMPQDQKEISYR
ncbi:hypothetical protein BJX61DRAFT_544292 [Aspergillus egyptiacus]|nr:hypothetical protein BJX61DRAFT_544292 [Aspergillus egyptiacus]